MSDDYHEHQGLEHEGEAPLSAAPHGTQMADTARRIRRFALIVIGLLVAGFLLVHFIKSFHESRLAGATEESASEAPLVDVVKAVPSPSAVALSLPGETAAWYESTIYARVDGYVGKWTADIGDHVKKSQVLATIETPDLDAQLSAARAKLNAAEALVKAREAQAAFAKTTWARWKGAPKGVVSEQERDAKKADYESAGAALNEAHAQVALDKADVQRYTVLTQFKKVTAPYDGVITERRIDIGNLVTAGSSTSTTPLYRMAEDNPIRVFVDVPQSAAGDIKPGLQAEVSLNDSPGKPLSGKVARTARAINPSTRTLRVETDLANPKWTLVPGMYVNVSFALPSAGLVEVPAAVLIFRTGGPEIAVVDGNHRVAFRKVHIVRDNGSMVEIGSGINAGEMAVLNISSRIADGETVQVSNATENTSGNATHAPAEK